MGRPQVLIVEDEMLVALDLETIVADAVTAAVVIATSLAEARRAADPDVCFAFLDMNVANGTTFEIAELLMAKDVGVAFVSGSDPADVPPRLRHLPFIGKPYRRDDVRQVLLAGIGAPRRRALS